MTNFFKTDMKEGAKILRLMNLITINCIREFLYHFHLTIIKELYLNSMGMNDLIFNN